MPHRDRLITFLRGLGGRPAVLVVVLVVTIYGLGEITKRTAESLAHEWLGPVSKAAEARAEAELNVPGSAPEQKRLAQQLEEIRARSRHHRKMMAYFFSRYYMAIAMAMLTGAAAAVLILRAGQDGWKNAPGRIVIPILVLGAASVYYGAFPALFQQEENALANAGLLRAYENLEGRALTYFATGRVPRPAGESGKALDPSDFILSLEADLSTLREIKIGFDPDEIPDFTEELTR